MLSQVKFKTASAEILPSADREYRNAAMSGQAFANAIAGLCVGLRCALF